MVLEKLAAARSKAKKGAMFSGTDLQRCCCWCEVRSGGGGEVRSIGGGEACVDMNDGGGVGSGERVNEFRPVTPPFSLATSTIMSPKANEGVCDMRPCVDPCSCVYV